MPSPPGHTREDLDVVIVGAGFAGLYMLHRVRQLGLSARVLEAGGGVGGTWFWNRYPGARCDVESLEYSYSFSEDLQQDWTWSERYAEQPEILRYIDHVADRFDLRRDIQLNAPVTEAHFDDDSDRWTLVTESGLELSARYCVMATGCLSSARVPEIKGLESFGGSWYHTGAWPPDGVDLTGRRVGCIGTGSSGIQAIPIIAEQASHLVVFQRTPAFTVPARNRPLDPLLQRHWKQNYPALRRKARQTPFGILVDSDQRSATEVGEDERRRLFEGRWDRGGLGFMFAFKDLLLSKRANDAAASFVRSKIAELVHDPGTAALLQAATHPIGAKRLCLDTRYYETFNRPNVTLVDIRDTPIEEITATGIRVANREYPLDTIVFATGFDAMTGSLLRIDLHGRRGISLRTHWADGPRTYLGVATAHFPNLFFITGPGSPSVLSNMIVSIEHHVDWISNCIQYMEDRGIDLIEATPQAVVDWTDHVNDLASTTLYPTADSWYVGANVPGKPRVFMPYVGGVFKYAQHCDAVAKSGYSGFSLTTTAPAR
jgi:cyclohexanone monooxygenase